MYFLRGSLQKIKINKNMHTFLEIIKPIKPIKPLKEQEIK